MTMDPDLHTGDDHDIPPVTRSPLDELRAEFERRREDPRLYKRFPAGANGRLAGEFRVLKTDETQEALRSDDDLEQNQDTLIAALVQIHIHDPKHAGANERGLVPLHTWAGSEDPAGPLRFDRRLLDLLGVQLDDTTARTIVLWLFEGNEIALGATAAQMMAWMTDTHEEGLQDFGRGS